MADYQTDSEVRAELRRIARLNNRGKPKVVTDAEYRAMKSRGMDMGKFERLSDFAERNKAALNRVICVAQLIEKQRGVKS